MADTFTTVTNTSFFGRIRDAVLGFIIGPLLLIAAVILIFWNESHSVRVSKSLNEGAGRVEEANDYDAENDGELVHVTGETASEGTLRDPQFGVSSTGIRLNRNVQVYAWTEHESSRTSDKLGGGKTTTKTYNYERKWVGSLPKSSHFKEPAGHENPSELKYHSKSFPADKVTLRSYTLDPELAAKLTDARAVPLDENSIKLPDGAQVADNEIYVGSNRTNPVVGDLRISETVVPNGTVSVVAGQGPSERLAPFHTDAGEDIGLIESGSKSAEEMFLHAHSANRTFTWVARVGGFLLLLFGFLLLLSPLATMSSIVPFFGGIVEAGTFVISLLAAMIIWMLLVAAAWMIARPLVGGVLFIVAAAATFLTLRHIHRGAKRRIQGSPVPPPLPT